MAHVTSHHMPVGVISSNYCNCLSTVNSLQLQQQPTSYFQQSTGTFRSLCHSCPNRNIWKTTVM